MTQEPGAPADHVDLDTLADLDEGLLSDDERTAAEAHLAGCRPCREQQARLRQRLTDGQPLVLGVGRLVPVIEPLVVSVAVMVWMPGVFRVARKKPAPLVKAKSGDRAAALSLLVR